MCGCEEQNSLGLSETSEYIMVTLEGQILDFDSSIDTSTQGLVIPNNGLSVQQLVKLSSDLTTVQSMSKLKKPANSFQHFHTPQLCLDDEQVRVLKLVCCHPLEIERLEHLLQLMVHWQHGVYVSEAATEHSLAKYQSRVLGFAPFAMVRMFNANLITRFHELACEHRANPYFLENLYRMRNMYPDVFFHPKTLEQFFMCLPQEEQEEIMSYTPAQMEILATSYWYLDDERYVQLHLERIRNKYPISTGSLACFSFIDSYRASSVKTENSGSMTPDEANDFNSIVSRFPLMFPMEYLTSKRGVPELFIYLYLKLGSADFEAFIRYVYELNQQDEVSGTKESVISTLLDSFELQELIVDISQENPELPMSLKLELSDLDWFSYKK